MSKVRVNYKSDIPPLEVKFNINGTVADVPDGDFAIRFYVEGSPGTSYECTHIGDTYTNCEKIDDVTLMCYIDNHKFGCGRLCCEFVDLAEDERYADGILKTVTPSCLDVVLVDGVGDDSVEALSTTFGFQPNEIASVVVVESNVDGGDNTVTITLTDGTEKTFIIKNGAKVNIGEVAIVDDLISGGSTKVLSAEQGKILWEILSNAAIINLQRQWVANRYYPTSSYSTVGEEGQTVSAYSADYSCLRVDLTQDFKWITFSCIGSSGATARPYYFLDEDDELLSIETSTSVVNVRLTPDDIPEGAVALYLNNRTAGGTPSCTIAVDRLDKVIAPIEARVDGLEDNLFVEETQEWTATRYYSTSDNHTIGEAGTTTTTYSGDYSCLRVDLTKSFVRINFSCLGSSNTLAHPYYFLDEDGILLSINTANTLVNVTLTPDDIPAGAVGLYLNNNTYNNSNPTCTITRNRLDTEIPPIVERVESLEDTVLEAEAQQWNSGKYYSTLGYHDTPQSKVPDAPTSGSSYSCLFVDLTKPFKSITFSCRGSSNNFAHAYFFSDSDGDWINVCLDQTVQNVTLTPENIPEGVVALYLNNLTSAYSNPTCTVVRSKIDNASGALLGKKVVMFGDSITEFTDGHGKSYSDYFAEITDATVYNVGIGGAHLCDSEVAPSTSNMYGLYINQMVQAWISQDFTNPDAGATYRATQGDTHDAVQVARLKTIHPRDTDIVTIMGGTNDNKTAVIGEPSDTNPAKNIFATVKAIVSAIHTNYPHIKVYFFTPMPFWKENSGGTYTDEGWSDNIVPEPGTAEIKMHDVCMGIARAAKYMHVPCCDMYYGMNFGKENWLAIAPDGVHPRNGFAAIGEKMAAFVTSGGVSVTADSEPAASSLNPVSSGGVYTALTGKQDSLVSGTNIKTINNQSLLGSGNITIQGGGGSGEQSDWNETDTSSLAYIKNKPTIPAAQIQADWNQATTTAKDYIKNKPTIPAAQVNADWNASSGVAQILNKPTIPTVPTNVSAFTNDAGYLNNNFCPIIEDTRSSAVATITGVAPFSALVNGQLIIVRLVSIPANNTSINLTLSNNTSTGDIPVYIDSYRQSEVRVGSGFFRANDYMFVVYDQARGIWKCLSQLDTATYYATFTQSLIDSGTNTENRLITPKLFHDNVYIVELSYSSGSLKANKMYDFGTVSSALTIPSLDATNDLVSNALNFYALRFIAGADNLNITFPTGVLVDDTPTINTGDYVEIMINKYGSNFYASIKVWQAQ